MHANINGDFIVFILKFQSRIRYNDIKLPSLYITVGISLYVQVAKALYSFKICICL